MENQDNQKQHGDNRKGLELFFQLSGWLVGPLVLALFLGRWLDQKYSTKPWLFLGFTGIAFIITVVGMGSQAVKFIREIEQEIKQKNDSYNQANQKEDNDNSKQY